MLDGRLHADARVWFKDSNGDFRPCKGIAIKYNEIPAVVAALLKARETMTATGR
jgi:hypothetical protein